MSGKSYSSYNAVRVVCPFYLGEDKGAVRCEGPERGSTLICSFTGSSKKQAYMEDHCQRMEGLSQCAIHAMMQRVWRGEV